MKPLMALASLIVLALAGCGRPPEPTSLAGEQQAASVVSNFLSFLRQGDLRQAQVLAHPKPDRIVGDLEKCRDYFFSRQPTGTNVLAVGREYYAREWHIYVDMQLNYGTQVKQLHFILSPGDPPKVRGVTPIVPR